MALRHEKIKHFSITCFVLEKCTKLATSVSLLSFLFPPHKKSCPALAKIKDEINFAVPRLLMVKIKLNVYSNSVLTLVHILHLLLCIKSKTVYVIVIYYIIRKPKIKQVNNIY